jgi:hypothetical protein
MHLPLQFPRAGVLQRAGAEPGVDKDQFAIHIASLSAWAVGPA